MSDQGAPHTPGLPTVIVLAAGEGKRMRSALPKVLHPLLGRTMLGHVLATVRDAFADREGRAEAQIAVVVGHGGAQVRQHLSEIAPQSVPVTQTEQRGTGHAVRTALTALSGLSGTVVVLNGDIPLLRASTLWNLVHTHEQAAAAATVLTATVPDPTGLGRIVRGADGAVTGIVEERDATPEQRAIQEINSGAYAFDVEALLLALGKLSTDNDQGEEYLTDVIGLMADSGARVLAHGAPDLTETLGANDRVELAQLRALLRERVNTGWMRAGVAIIDPATTWIDVTVVADRDAVVEPNTHLRGSTTIGEGACVGPDTTLIDTTVGPGAVVLRTHAVEAQIGPQAQVGPFAYLRPGTRLARRSKVGTFVETKATEIGEGAKVPHLSYLGDTTVGAGTNIGAATVTANYDGTDKHRTVIGAHARVGVDNMLVAPVVVGDGAYTAAGSVIVEDVPPGAMAIARGRQRNVEGWVARQRPGTAAAQAAETALAAEAARAAAESAGSEAEQSHDPVGEDDHRNV